MKTAVVTGASSGIGKGITNKLLELGYSVIGISRTISSDDINRTNFLHIKADLSNERDTITLCDRLRKEEVSILVNAAGFGRFRPHEELNAKTIIEMTFLNLTAPMLVTNATLRSLKKLDGYLININSIEAIRASKFAAVYSATKAGLKSFSDALFEETRRSGLSITNINPDMTESNFYEELNFTTTTKDDEKLLCEDIASSVEHILSMRKGAVVSDYTIRSLKFGILKKKL